MKVSTLSHATTKSDESLEIFWKAALYLAKEGSEKIVETCLSRLISHYSLKTKFSSSKFPTVPPSDDFAGPSNNLKRDFFINSRKKNSRFAGPYKESLFCTVKQIFKQNCLAFEFPEF